VSHPAARQRSGGRRDVAAGGTEISISSWSSPLVLVCMWRSGGLGVRRNGVLVLHERSSAAQTCLEVNIKVTCGRLLPRKCTGRRPGLRPVVITIAAAEVGRSGSRSCPAHLPTNIRSVRDLDGANMFDELLLEGCSVSDLVFLLDTPDHSSPSGAALFD